MCACAFSFVKNFFFVFFERTMQFLNVIEICERLALWHKHAVRILHSVLACWRMKKRKENRNSAQQFYWHTIQIPNLTKSSFFPRFSLSRSLHSSPSNASLKFVLFFFVHLILCVELHQNATRPLSFYFWIIAFENPLFTTS